MNILIKNPLVLLYDEENDVSYGGQNDLRSRSGRFRVKKRDIAICGDTIAAVGADIDPGERRTGDIAGRREDFLTHFRPDITINGEGRLVIPGLINAHTHNYMTLFRNLADDVPFSKWLFEGVMPHEDRMLPEDAYWGALLGIMEMLRSGTTCFNDMQMHIHQTARAAADAGIRAVIGRGITDTEGPDGLLRRLREAGEEIDRWSGHPLLSFAIAPHAPYTCSREGLIACADEAKRRNLPLHIHLSESEQEVADMKAARGITPVAYAESIGLFDVPAIVAHATQADTDDIKILARRGVSVVTNPASNMKLGNGFAPVPEMLAAGVNVAVGTDGAASNNALNLFREMNLLSLIHKGTKKDAVSVSAQDVLKMATVNGAKALFGGNGSGSVRIDGGCGGVAAGDVSGGKESGSVRTGRIAPGYRADLAILSLNCPQMRPFNNIISGLAYAANGSEVETVIVNGEIVVSDGHCTKIDEERVYYEAGVRLR